MAAKTVAGDAIATRRWSTLWRKRRTNPYAESKSAQKRIEPSCPDHNMVIVRRGQRTVGMMKNVSDGEIVSQGGIDQRSRGNQDSDERGHAGAARRFRQAISNRVFTYGCDDPDHKAVAGQRQSE